MRKNYLSLTFLLLLNTIMFGQKVTLTSTNGPINLGNSNYLSFQLVVQVDMPSIPGNNGTLKIYSVNDLKVNVVPGGDGGFLFFGEGKTALANFLIQLNAGDFPASGSSIYAEYKTSGGVTYKSSNMAITKNGTTPPSPAPASAVIEHVPYGGIPILPQFTVYDDKPTQEWINSQGQVVNTSLPVYSSIGALYEKNTFSDGRVIIDKSISYSVANFLSQYYNVSVINTIGQDQYLINGENPQTIIGNQASESHTDKPTDVRPSNGEIRPTTTTTSLNNYQWQSRIKFPLTWYDIRGSYFQVYGWIDITGATQINYTPPKSSTAMEYRRLIIENPADRALYRKCTTSNVINIIPLNTEQTKNIICCDQTVNSNEFANPITGDYQNNVSYQWLISEDNINWKEIYGATQQNYNPTQITNEAGVRGQPIPPFKEQFYKRIMYNFSNNNHSISNIVKINFKSISETISSKLKIYPNPVKSILNIENTLSNATLVNSTITNTTGNTITPNNYSLINSNLITLDVSNLPAGIYFLNIALQMENATRPYKYQTTFIKQ